MNNPEISLKTVYEGWDSYQASLVSAITPRTKEQLIWKPSPQLRSAGQITAHIVAGRLGWFFRMGAPGSSELMDHASRLETEESIADDASALVSWLNDTWNVIEETLRIWTVDDLMVAYQQSYQGKTYSVTRQWTIWRIIAHDIHHGGELAYLLGFQGISIPELGDLGGHLTMPAIAESDDN